MVDSSTDGGESEINWNVVVDFMVLFLHIGAAGAFFHYNPHIFFLV
jgi:hypothetical protein